jgi:hypothetical protein
MARCPALAAKGDQCSGTAAKGAKFCYLHDPQFAAKRSGTASRAAKSKGGSELADLKRELKILFDDVRLGKAEPKRSAVAAQVGNTLIRLIALEKDVREQEEILARIARLDAAL